MVETEAIANRQSSKPIPPEERLIVALDIPNTKQAKELVEHLGDSVSFYKLGLELFMAGGYFELVEWLRERGKRVFVDLKFFDVPETVASAVRQLRQYGADFATVHGNDSMLKAAAGEKNGTKILAVTVLTSLDQGDMEDLGFEADINKIVLSRARRALEVGCDGVISSGLEAQDLRKSLGENFLIITPGIRPGSNQRIDDQKRTVDVEDAFHKGADYIVVGRPIRDADDPKAAAEDVQARIRSLFAADGGSARSVITPSAVNYRGG
ncbi:orotidine 5'-phosphate decarboxylase [Halorhodospira halochloris]|uniref:Orotidine 5'-phosphate decarboxylase n=1 Tax=Halorhodospira halochloris TaxID=1052 RepID=A0A0X8XAI9_HALHR|nr:orotidine-5'-phosphate decarboxylase [Halorhodospira halochloris]MCG5548730.1 orotidine-5'-phosphate decarboxylase [Halorhodospira halochloris]BAU57873.1 orotidine 5'-phosphate decarboxylase [Halorhodospira halochloris]